MAQAKSTEDFNLDFILDYSCGNPKDFREWEAWEAKRRELRAQGVEWDDLPEYTGVMIYDITVHCNNWVIETQKIDGKRTIVDILTRDH